MSKSAKSRGKVLLTNTKEGAGQLAGQLRGKGFEIVNFALLEIEPVLQPPKWQGDEQGLVLTSLAAVRSLHTANVQVRNLPVWCVGAGTARAASEAGFENVITGPGNASALAMQMMETINAAHGPLLWLRAEKPAFDLAAKLASAGIVLREHIAYRVRPVTLMPISLQDALVAGEFVAITLHSARAARSLMQFSLQLSAKTTILTYSEQVAKVLLPAFTGQIEVISAPAQDVMVAALCRMFPLS